MILAGVTCISARLAGFEREKSFYPLLLIFMALQYLLFSVIDSNKEVIIGEGLVITIILVLSVSGYKINQWWLVTGFAAHSLWDYFHNAIIHNQGVPSWWPEFCLGYNVLIALYLFLNCQRRGI